jgi:hypothetical protein
MARRWYVPLLALPVVIGTVVAVAVGVASASPGLTHRTASAAAVQRIFPGAPMARLPGTVPRLSANGTQLTSNWAGYAVTGRRGTFHGVSASWIQPTAHCGGVRDQRLAAFWVGLDGFAPGDNNVEQTGAVSDCNASRPTYLGWYEFFPLAPVFYRNVLRPGDQMSASVTFRGTRTYVLVLTDHTRRWSHVITKNAVGKPRTSAEVIAEAPTGTSGILPLADFGTVRFSHNRVNGTLLLRMPRIRIVMVQQNPPNAVKCRTGPVGSADAFINAWVRTI